MAKWCIPFWVTFTLTFTSCLISRFFLCLEHISYITANFPQMCLMLDQFLWGHSSHDCDISCYEQLKFHAQLSWAWKKFYYLRARKEEKHIWAGKSLILAELVSSKSSNEIFEGYILISEICALPEDSGNCLAYNKNWRYDNLDGTCKEFTFGGCGGNKNNFGTRGECERFCGRTGKLLFLYLLVSSQPASYLGPLTVRQRNAIQMAFSWRPIVARFYVITGIYW